MRQLIHRSRLLVGCAGALLLASCSVPTESLVSDVALHRAHWEQHGLTRYAYDYVIGSGFFIATAGHTIRLVVVNDTVTSATDMTTGQTAGSPSAFPTIDQLYDEAAGAAADHTLAGATYDPVLDYPTTLSLSGPPDASGTLTASHLQPLP